MKKLILLIFCLLMLVGCSAKPDETTLNAIDNYEETNEKEVLVIFLPNGEFINYPIENAKEWGSYVVFTTNVGEKITVSSEMDWILVNRDFYYGQMVKDLKDCEVVR